MKSVFNKFFTIVFAFFALSISTQVLAKQNVWTEGFAQGTTEYFIESGDYWLLISCTDKDDEEAAPSSVTVYNNKTSMSVKAATVTVNGHTFTLPIKANSRVGTNNFIVLLDNLQSSDAVVKFNGNTLTLKKNASNKIIPKYGNGFTCNMF